MLAVPGQANFQFYRLDSGLRGEEVRGALLRSFQFYRLDSSYQLVGRLLEEVGFQFYRLDSGQGGA